MKHRTPKMTTVEKILAEKGANGDDRPPDPRTTGGPDPQRRVLPFTERAEQMSHEESENGHTNSSAGFSNGYENSTDSEAIMSGQSSSHTDHDPDRRHRTADQSDSGSTQFLDPPNPPNLRSRHTDQPFGVLREVGHREVIKLSIEFPLKMAIVPTI